MLEFSLCSFYLKAVTINAWIVFGIHKWSKTQQKEVLRLRTSIWKSATLGTRKKTTVASK